MITAEELRSITLRKSFGGGYKAEDVDRIIEDVIWTLEKLTSERNELKKKLALLSSEEKLNINNLMNNKGTEETVNSEFAKAKISSEKLLTEAKFEADKIISSAKDEANLIIENANSESEKIKSKIIEMKDISNKDLHYQKALIEDLHDKISDFRAELIDYYKRHINIISALPDSNDVIKLKIELEENYPEVSGEKYIEELKIKSAKENSPEHLKFAMSREFESVRQKNKNSENEKFSESEAENPEKEIFTEPKAVEEDLDEDMNQSMRIVDDLVGYDGQSRRKRRN